MIVLVLSDSKGNGMNAACKDFIQLTKHSVAGILEDLKNSRLALGISGLAKVLAAESELCARQRGLFETVLPFMNDSVNEDTRSWEGEEDRESHQCELVAIALPSSRNIFHWRFVVSNSRTHSYEW